MRWKVESTPVPFPLDTRIREHFLFRPRVINKECRWLEKLNINSVTNRIVWIGWI